MYIFVITFYAADTFLLSLQMKLIVLISVFSLDCVCGNLFESLFDSLVNIFVVDKRSFVRLCIQIRKIMVPLWTSEVHHQILVPMQMFDHSRLLFGICFLENSVSVSVAFTVSVKKNLHQDCGPCYLHLPIFSCTYNLLFCCKIKSCCDPCFPHQVRPQTIFQLYILQDYSSVRIGFNMNHKYHTLPIVYTMLV